MNEPPDPTGKPIVYSCSGCSSIAQLANQVALDLDRFGVAEMSCIVGVGGKVKPLVKKAKSGRPLVVLDGCPLQCARHCLSQHGLEPTLHYTLTRMGIEKHYHQDFDPGDKTRVESQIWFDLKQLKHENELVSSQPTSGNRAARMLLLRSLFFTLLFPGTMTVLLPYLIVSASQAARLVSGWGWRMAGMLLVMGGATGLLRCIWEFYATGRGTLAPVDPPKVLVARGLYRYVRNPMYVAVLTVLSGETILFQSAGIALAAAAFWLVTHLFVVFYEEPALGRLFGDSYQEYRQQVGRWIPRVPQ